jgi:membrane fusion protein (multidrug efflux system)
MLKSSNITLQFPRVSFFFKKYIILIIGVATIGALAACNSTSGSEGMSFPPQALPVVTLTEVPATSYQEFTATIEGIKDIELRPQVDGILEKIFVDEGAYVKKGQPLFYINSRIYQEQVNNAQANLATAKANLVQAEINVNKITPLVQNNVISDVQLKTAKASYDAAAAGVAQAQAMLHQAQINVGYTLIKAPVEGYIGRIPFKIGSLVGTTTTEPLTVLSETKDVYAYFSLSEKDFLQFRDQFQGATIQEKIKQMPPVELLLADNSVYAQKGKVQLVSGQFNNSTGTISFRAGFKNSDGMLRSGITGKIRIPHSIESALVVPQESTFELQDKVFVFSVSDSNVVAGVPITVTGKSGNYYLVSKGVKPGEKIVYTGLDRLKDGMSIQPQPISMDSLIKTRPL